jgi:riboflavin kinase / FMN adenylyltransferase
MLIHGLHNLKRSTKSCIATIGNFDGVHLGHQALLHRMKKLSTEWNLPTTLVLFEPQPEEVLVPEEQVPSRLCRLREKITFLKPYELDQIIVMPFNKKFAEFSAAQFVQHILFEKLNVRHLIVGDDFHFGKQRLGNFEYLKEVAEQFQFTVENVSTHRLSTQKSTLMKPMDRRISSTWIREALLFGDLTLAKRLLGRPYSMCGRVIHGDKIVNDLDFPTATIYLHRKKVPLLGVYAVEIHEVEKKPLFGIANLANKALSPSLPSSKNGNFTKIMLEIYLFDFNRDLYGQSIETVFLHKIRDEKTFSSVEDLKKQVLIDIQQAKLYFQKENKL